MSTTSRVVISYDEPAVGPTFAELLAGKARVVVVDNQFRPTPSSKLLPAVFDVVEAAGVGDARVSCERRRRQALRDDGHNRTRIVRASRRSMPA